MIGGAVVGAGAMLAWAACVPQSWAIPSTAIVVAVGLLAFPAARLGRWLAQPDR